MFLSGLVLFCRTNAGCGVHVQLEVIHWHTPYTGDGFSMGKNATARRMFRQQWLQDPNLKGKNVLERLMSLFSCATGRYFIAKRFLLLLMLFLSAVVVGLLSEEAQWKFPYVYTRKSVGCQCLKRFMVHRKAGGRSFVGSWRLVEGG